MGEKNCLLLGVWSMITGMIIIVCIFIINISNSEYRGRRRSAFPPGRLGWPILGDTFSWYNAVASSHPPSFVQQQAQRFGKIFSCNLLGKRAVVSVDPGFNRFVMQNEGKLFQSSYPKSFRDLVGKNGVITVQGEQQRKLHAIASNLMRLNNHFLNDIQMILVKTFANLRDSQVILLQDVCRKAAINLMVNQLLGVYSESEINEMAQLFSDFVDGCLSVPVNIPGFAYHAAMKEEHDNLKVDSSTDKMLTWQDYKSMIFTQCVIDETLRLGGIAIWLMREAKEDVAYQDYVIPKGCFVVPFLSAVHMDESLYKGSLSFNPWRWLELENQEKRNWRSSPFYSPFGGGARFCPGAELARLQIALFLHYFVLTYRWTQLKEDQMSFFPSARLVNGFQIFLSKRSDK